MSSISKPNTFSPNTTASSSQVNANFDTIYNDYNGGISAVNLASNAVTTAKIADANVTTAKLADASVTPAKRSGGFKTGFITAATLGTTGNKSVTGVGFTPKKVTFYTSAGTTDTASSAGTSARDSTGIMTANGQFVVMNTADGTSGGRNSRSTGCGGFCDQSGTIVQLFSYVSMDADGFTINVDTASSALGQYWIAEG